MASQETTIWYVLSRLLTRLIKIGQVALDYIPKAGLNWVGNVNELNAGIHGAMLAQDID